MRHRTRPPDRNRACVRACVLVLAGALVVPACGTATAGEDAPAAAVQAGAAQPVATLDAAGTLRLPGVDAAVFARALVRADGAVAVVAERAGDSTTVRWLATADGAERAAVTVPGWFVPAAMDVPGDFVALVPPAGGHVGETIAPARDETEIVVVDTSGERFRTTLSGNFLPEAFGNWFEPGSSLPGSLFVLEYLPAGAPTQYRVRTLALGDGRLGLPLNLRDKTKTVDQQMAGISRSALLAADSGLLFTLYRGHHDEGHGSYAFVHALGLGDGVWCLVVPPTMELEARSGALGLDPTGRRLLLVSGNGTIAEIEIDAVSDLTRSPDFSEPRDLGVTTDGTPALVAAGAHVWVGLGPELLQLDAGTLDVTARTTLAMPVEALAVDAAGSLLVAGADRLLTIGVDLAVQADVALAPGDAPIARIAGI